MGFAREALDQVGLLDDELHVLGRSRSVLPDTPGRLDHLLGSGGRSDPLRGHIPPRVLGVGGPEGALFPQTSRSSECPDLQRNLVPGGCPPVSAGVVSKVSVAGG